MNNISKKKLLLGLSQQERHDESELDTALENIEGLLDAELERRAATIVIGKNCPLRA